VIIIFGINRLKVFKGGIQYTKMKINRNFNAFIDLKSLELKVLTIYLIIKCVLLYKDKRYIYS
jgi:ABC-type glucose/galactose transport system permease subunit